jgi:Ca2+-binding RTX toxin-like protein
MAVICNGREPTIYGTLKNDNIIGTMAPDVIASLGGNDTVRASLGNDTICGGPGHDVIRGGLGNDTIYAEAGNDFVQAERGNDTIYSGLGNDEVAGELGDDNLINDKTSRDNLSGSYFVWSYKYNEARAAKEKNCCYGQVGTQTECWRPSQFIANGLEVPAWLTSHAIFRIV